MEKNGIFEDFNTFLVKRLESYFKDLNKKGLNIFVSGSGMKGKEELCHKTADFLFHNKVNYIYRGSDTGSNTCEIYKKLAGEKDIYHNIFQFKPSMKDFRDQKMVNHHQMVWDRDSNLSLMRRHIISLAHMVICFGGRKGSEEEEKIAKELNKQILYASERLF